MSKTNVFPIDLKKLTDKERHDYVLQTFILNKQQSEEQRRYKRDIDVIRENHRFLWDDAEEVSADDWELRLARRYYEKLFKEYCIADLTRFKENKVALRWRTEAEVVAGIGQFECGSRKCKEREELRSWEVNFAYQEQGLRKNALVKLRLCPEHAAQLNYTSKKREVKRLRQQHKLAKREEKKLKKQQKTAIKISQLAGEDESNSDDEMSDKQIEPEETSTITAVESALEEHFCPTLDADGIWRKKSEVSEETTNRENDFERYLEDLLL